MTQTTQRRDFADLVSLLAAERDAYALTLSLSRGQERVFLKGGARSLMKIIARKQTVIDGLALIDKALSVYTADWNATLTALPALARKEVGALVAEIGEIIDALMQSERGIANVVANKRDETSARIRNLGQRRGAASAYGKGALAATGRLLDREG